MQKQKNEIVIEDGYALMYVTTKYEPEPLEVVIDIEDVPKVEKYKWCAYKSPTGSYYIRGSIAGKNVALHRYIMNYSGKLVVDHIDGNTLDNRKQNLRIVTQAVNAQNTHNCGIHQSATGSWYGLIVFFGKVYYTKASKFRDIAEEYYRLKKLELESRREELAAAYYALKPERNVWPTVNGKWQADICINSKTTHLGPFETREEAIAARDAAEAEKKKAKAASKAS